MRQTHVPNDAQVIIRSRDRPEEFSELYRRHARAVFRYAASRLGREHADDVVSEALLVAFQRRGSFDPEVESALPWLLGIATRLIRKRRREETAAWRAVARASGLGGAGTDRSGHDPAEAIDDRLDAHASIERISSAIAALPARDRDVLTLTAWSDLDASGIAEALAIPEGTVWSRLNRARRALRNILDADAVRISENDHEYTTER
ncbi:sigma-70 family RNA polymerase sigma factor [Leucobacter sp. gxy201]|uniref:RNA polymerase sigma factor n=1 Tax=Leucobacter sp. gxy201 TaxID=2957200 RepID=UPI003DA1396C